MGTKSASDLPRGRDLFRDAIAQSQSIAIDSSVHILPERAWTFAEYGRDWALDLFAVTHNAMRSELRDLYGITVSFAKRKDAISESDIENFFVWWPPFATFIVNALSLGDELIFPTFQHKVAMAGPVSAQRRKQLIVDVGEHCAGISEYAQTFRTSGYRELLGDLISFVDNVVPDIVKTMSTAEKETATYMLKHPELEVDQSRFFEEVCVFAEKLPAAHEFVVLWSRGFRSTELRKIFMNYYVAPKKKKGLFQRNGKPKQWFDDFYAAEKHLTETHFAAIREFWRAWRMADDFLHVREQDIKYPLPKKIELPVDLEDDPEDDPDGGEGGEGGEGGPEDKAEANAQDAGDEQKSATGPAEGAQKSEGAQSTADTEKATADDTNKQEEPEAEPKEQKPLGNVLSIASRFQG